MGSSVTRKIIEAHLVEGQWAIGSEIAIRIDQTLTQDATGTMAYLQFEAIGIPRVKTELSVSYVDHNTLQSDFKNADDHGYLRTVAAKHGIVFSRPGNGICHQLHLERFARPGRTLIGSRLPHAHRGRHRLAGDGRGRPRRGRAPWPGEPFRIKVPAVVGVQLTGQLPAVGLGQGRHPGAAAARGRQGRRRQGVRVLRARRGDAVGARPRHHHQHGRRDWAAPPRSSRATA